MLVKRHDQIKNLILNKQDILGKVEIICNGRRKEIFLSGFQYAQLLFLFRDSNRIWKIRNNFIRKYMFQEKKIRILKSKVEKLQR